MPLTEQQKRWLDSHPELKPSSSAKKRKDGHNYRGRCIYLITMCIEGRRPLLGTLHSPDEWHKTPHVILSDLGKKVLSTWQNIPHYYPEVEAMKIQIMPDHLHGILFFKQEVAYHLGQVINGFKKGCNDAYKLINDSTFTKLWETEYTDTILAGTNHLDIMKSYIADNPRRLWVKQHNVWLFKKHSIVVDGRSVDVMGNLHLLSYKEKAYVQCTNKLDTAGIEAAKSRFIMLAQEGKVLVTAGISKVEKGVMNWALDNNHELILVVENGMSQLWKPSGKQFDACANGSLLIVAPWEYSKYPRKICRDKCLAMNDMALAIVNGNFSL